MLFLDTNAFYYASGISENFTYDYQKLRGVVDQNEVVLSTTSLFEFIIKYANDRKMLEIGGRYLEDKNFKIAGNLLNPIPDNLIRDLHNIDSKNFKQLYEEVLRNKIEVESKYTHVLMCMCFFAGLYFTAMKDGKEPSGYCYATFEAVFKMFTQHTLEAFQEAYSNGYKTDDCENYIKGCFNNLLAFVLEKGIPFVEAAKLVTDDKSFFDFDSWLDPEEYSRRTLSLATKLTTERSTDFLQKNAVTYWKNNDDNQLSVFIERLTSPFNKKVPWQAMQDYFHDALLGIMTTRAVFRKNDLLDTIILCNLQESHTIITYDGGMIKRMEKRKDEYLKYKESLDLIHYLKS